jgi:hypothetical protein
MQAIEPTPLVNSRTTAYTTTSTTIMHTMATAKAQHKHTLVLLVDTAANYCTNNLTAVSYAQPTDKTLAKADPTHRLNQAAITAYSHNEQSIVIRNPINLSTVDMLRNIKPKSIHVICHAPPGIKHTVHMSTGIHYNGPTIPNGVMLQGTPAAILAFVRY